MVRSKVMYSGFRNHCGVKEDICPEASLRTKCQEGFKPVYDNSFLATLSVILITTWDSQKGTIREYSLWNLKFCLKKKFLKKKKILLFWPWLYRWEIHLYMSPFCCIHLTFVKLFCCINYSRNRIDSFLKNVWQVMMRLEVRLLSGSNISSASVLWAPLLRALLKDCHRQAKGAQRRGAAAGAGSENFCVTGASIRERRYCHCTCTVLLY